MGCAAGELEVVLFELLAADELAAVRLAVDLPARGVVGCATPGFAAAGAPPDCAGDTPAAAGSFGVPARFPVDEFSAMTNLSGRSGTVSTLHSAMRPLRYPVQQYRCSPLIREDASSGRKTAGPWLRNVSAMCVFAGHPEPYGFGSLRFARQRRNQRNEKGNQEEAGQQFREGRDCHHDT